MNKLFNLGAMLTIAAGAAFVNSSCSSHDFETLTPAEIAQANYEKAFVTRFGQPAANQTWGFGEATKACIKTDMTDYQKYEPAPAVNPAEFEEIQKAFQNIPENYVSEQIDYSDFFVQHISMSYRTYKDGYDKDVIGSNQMNQLRVWKDENTSEHALDFNKEAGSTVLFVNEGTYKFSYSNSSDEGKNYFDYIVKKVGDYYYVGFSFKANGSNPNMQIEGDNNYDDWIVRIVPAKLKGDIRVIAEDLNVDENSDFDFNDVVFDIAYGNSATIILRAAGGTMPLRVGGEEVHEKFGVSTSTMVNTGNGVTKDPVVFTINQSCWSAYEANNIPVEVQKDGEWIEIKAIKGKAAAKIAVPTTYEWCSEREDIAEKYPKFNDYVTSSDWETIEWWVK